MSLIKHFARNTAGRDWAVGDIHGHFTRLQVALDAAGFDPLVDRLFSVGDLVDRGPESEQAVEWLAQPWFHAVRGNHEQMAIESHTLGPSDMHLVNGGVWFYALSFYERAEIAASLANMPIAIEVETAHGMVGIVHADVAREDWAGLVLALEQGGSEGEHVQAMCQWSRRRISEGDTAGVAGVRALVVGHTPLLQPAVLGNVYHIDTAGWLPDGSGYFTLLDLHTLEAVPPLPAKIQLEVA